MRSASTGLLLMAGTVLASCLTIAAAIAQPAAGDGLVKMQTNAANVVMPTITYDAQRYSKLNQITADNVGKLQVAWTFSTGVLRGHEGEPLVIGNVMYLARAVPQYRVCARPEPGRQRFCGNTSRSRIRTLFR